MSTSLRLVGQRLKEYLQTRGLSITGVARMSAFSRQELDAIVDGGPYPISRLLTLLHLFEDLNPRWLLKGEEPMLLKSPARLKREYREDLEARAFLERASAVPPANPELRQQVQELTTEVERLRGTVSELAARLEKLERMPGSGPDETPAAS